MHFDHIYSEFLLVTPSRSTFTFTPYPLSFLITLRVQFVSAVYPRVWRVACPGLAVVAFYLVA